MVLTVKDVSSKLLVTPTTAKHDIVGLINKGLLSEISLNRQKKGYIRGSQYQEKVEAVFKHPNYSNLVKIGIVWIQIMQPTY